MSTDAVDNSSESATERWTELDERFFALVGGVLSTSFLWGAATLLGSYDPDDASFPTSTPSRPSQVGPLLPSQRTIAG